MEEGAETERGHDMPTAIGWHCGDMPPADQAAPADQANLVDPGEATATGPLTGGGAASPCQHPGCSLGWQGAEEEAATVSWASDARRDTRE